MLSYIVRRLAAGVVLLFVISGIAYATMFLSGGDIARRLLGQMATEDQVAAKAGELGLDQPLVTRYFDWLGSALGGDFGRSWFTGEPVAQALENRLPVTLTLVIGTTLVVAVVSVLLGTAAAVRRGWLDRTVQLLSVAGYALPGFWIALLLALVVAVELGWFPATGYVPFSLSVAGWLSTITLPIAALSIGAVASTTQQVRGAMIDVLRQDYIRTLRSRGLPRRRVLLRHALRNASGPGLTVLALQFIGLMGGAVFVEQIFALPGIGLLAVNATTRGDIPMVMGVVVVTVVLVTVVNLLIDIAVGFLNPKARVR
ncbi:ABC transporter permease [Streptomyces millisiae]|uniref:ABC transporter permease n=1 Tax=Streptomyces millisiae TaxID=3075542 RepID=A0ABU2LKY0_9ACTN|nr:ABC transporter permease [Streptomyces sp. DSM 44918]MDT0317913.1 ABC transporter permease [Streptomyces sp. DSM 44918]